MAGQQPGARRPGGAMDIAILRPLSIVERGGEGVPTAPQPRATLAPLACQAGRVVSTEAIIEELWGEQVPRSATTTVQTYAMQIRGHIAAALGRAGEPFCAAKSVLVTRGRGYQLTSHGGRSDLASYERLA